MLLISTAGAINKILPLGDSITKGVSSGVDEEAFQISYRKTLFDKLKAAGYVANDELFVGTLISGQSVADFDPNHDGHSAFCADETVDGRIGAEAQGILKEWLTAAEPIFSCCISGPMILLSTIKTGMI